MSVKKIVVLGTGGTIAGVADKASDHSGYRAGQLAVAQLVDGLPGTADVLQGCDLSVEQLAQIDSKDMNFSVWARLAARLGELLAQEDVQGVVITHGTDTLEETAYFLHCVLAPRKPVVLTCAMRPATAVAPDGPQNLLDALALARCEGVAGVLTVCAGTVHGPLEVQKIHPYRLDAFSSGDAGALAYVEQGTVRQVRAWPVGVAAQPLPGQFSSPADAGASPWPWPWVEIVQSHAGAAGAAVDALVAGGVRGLVVAATGNGTVHQAVQAALLRAQSAGVLILRANRCPLGELLVSRDNAVEAAPGLSPVKARIALMLRLMRLHPAAVRRAL